MKKRPIFPQLFSQQEIPAYLFALAGLAKVARYGFEVGQWLAR